MQVATRLKYAIKAPFRLCGLDLIVQRPDPLNFLKALGIRTVVDAGAHCGAFVQAVRRVLPTAVIHAFEPLPEPFAKLARISKTDARVHAWNLALGAQCGTCKLQVGSSQATSSFLNSGAMRRYFPQASVVSSVAVEMVTLNDWSRRVGLEPPVLLKADVQGYEGHVLTGATDILRHTFAVLLEVSFEELYAGQPLFEEIHDLMRGHGFILNGMIDPIHEPGTGRQIQSNAIFGRPGVSAVLKEKCGR